ncbi:MAG: hypothetical protein LBC87_07795 [Fibromonadaceae bacterium]|jgi:hypothetical protein|nr:hypothetical protein [Fibromonadaceae bacterium]
MSSNILSIAALLVASSIVLAQGVPAPAVEAAPVAAVPETAPIPAEVPAATVVALPKVAPIVVATESVPAQKPAEPAVSVAGTKISLYGFLQLNAVYEDGANGGLNWSNYAPLNAQDGEGRLLINVNQTRLGLNLAGQPKESGAEVSGKFESDFVANQNRNNNGVNGFRIRHAYGQLKFNDIGLSVLFGQTQDIIAPLVAPSLNQGALQGQGSLGTRRPMIRLAEFVGPIEAAVAVTDNRETATPVLPAFQGSLKTKVPASWAGEKQNVEFTLSGHYASRETAAETEAEKDAKDASGWEAPPISWSGVASLSLPVISIVNLSGEFFLGQNLSNYNVGSIGQNANSKDGEGLKSLGGWGAANVKLPANFALAGGYGFESIDKKREPSTANGPARIKNAVIFANLKYFVDESVFIGFEYANLATDYVVDNSGDNHKTDDGKLNRFELVFNYSFK